ncbi:hypothetical protein KVT40_003780 [Elsinoe batatas]|uniref:Rhodopsin domain-containing protein n=1 Tax=Elsinoe batatas TaxID=2601811 RepID=A0A8K0L2I1_9PEZI|nr:hypothetical protein KVT40_003780 [Elsinoe batatas]
MLPDRAPNIIITAVVLYTISLSITALRVYVRWKKLKTDDWLMLLCMLLYTAYTIVQIASVPYGNGMHLENTTIDRASTAMLYWFLAGLLYEPATIILKLSVGASLLLPTYLVLVWDSTWRLKVKITIVLLLSLGSLAGIATTIRMVYGFAAKDVYDKTSSEFLFESTPIAILSTAEVGIGITAASAATLRPLFDKCFGRRKKALQAPASMARRKSSAVPGVLSRSWSALFMRSLRSERRPTLPVVADEVAGMGETQDTQGTQGTLMTATKKEMTWNDMPDLMFVSEMAVSHDGPAAPDSVRTSVLGLTS